MKKCERCGNENLDRAKFCDSCGAALPDTGEYAQQPISEPPPLPSTPPQQPQPAGMGGAGVVEQPRGAVLRSEMTGMEYPLEPGAEAMIGRGDPSRGLNPEVTLDDAVSLSQGVSRLHAKIITEADNFYLVDLNSTNATKINGTKLTPQQVYSLRSGDIIELGNYRLTFMMR